jgi:hypothetical protein
MSTIHRNGGVLRRVRTYPGITLSNRGVRGVNMIVAIVTVHGAYELFMNWTGAQKGEGFEFHLLVLAMVVFLIIRGGALSVDRAITVSFRRKEVV